MLKYKNEYKVVTNKDSNGKILNKDDNYIQCVPIKYEIQIYRYNSDTLVVQFNSTGVANNRIKELSALGVQLTTLQCGDDERTYTFKETDFSTVAKVVKARKKYKQNLSEEERLLRRERLINSRKK